MDHRINSLIKILEHLPSSGANVHLKNNLLFNLKLCGRNPSKECHRCQTVCEKSTEFIKNHFDKGSI